MVFKYATIFIIIFFCIVGIGAINSYNKELTWDTTEKALDNAYRNVTLALNTKNLSPNIDGTIIRIVYKIVDATTYVIIETAKVAGKLAIENPQINFKLILWLLLIGLILTVALPLLKISVIIGILIIDIYHHFKEKKILQKLREKHEK